MKNLPRVAMVLLLAAAAATAATLQEGRDALAEGRTAEAVRILSEVHKANPRNVRVMLALARACWQDGRDAEAVRLWRQVRQVDPPNAAAKAAVDAAARLQQEFAAALKQAAAMLDAHLPKPALALLRKLAGGYVPSAQVGALRYQTARALAATGDAKAAARTAAEAAELAPPALAAKARLLAAELHVLKLNAPEIGLTVLAKLKLTGVDGGRAALLRGHALRALGKPDDAAAAYAEARKLLAGQREQKDATDALVAVHLSEAARQLAAPAARGKANAHVEAAVALAVEATNSAATEPDRAAAFAALYRAVDMYRRADAPALTAAGWDAVAGKLTHPPLARRAQLEAAVTRLAAARADFERTATVRTVKPKLADVGGAALDALDRLLTGSATDEVAAAAAKQYVDHAGWLAGRGQQSLAVEVYLRLAGRHGKAARSPEALLAAARLLRELARVEASKLPKVEKLLSDDAKALAQAWALLKTYPTRREAGEAVGLVTSIARFYASREARGVAMAVYRDLLKNVPDAAEAAAARFNLAGLHLAEALAANRKLVETGQGEKAKALSADFKAALTLLAAVLGDPDETRAPLRTKAVAEVNKVAAHFRSLEAWDLAAGVLADAAKAAVEKAERAALALARIDLRMAQGNAAMSREKAVARKLVDGKLLAGHEKVPQLVIDLVRSLEPTDSTWAAALGRLDDLANRYAAEKLWQTALGVYVLKGAQVAPKSVPPRLGLRQAQLQKRRAMAELAVLLTTTHRPAKLPETEYVQAALGALSAVVKNHAATPEAVAAVGEVRTLSKYYEGQTAHAVARKILDDFAKAHAAATFAEALRLDAIGVSLAAVRRQFAEAKELDTAGPPFAAFDSVLAEYKAFIGGSQDAALIESAYNQILSVPPLHASRGLHAAAVALYERFLKDFAGYDRADEIWYRVGVTRLESVIGGGAEGKLAVRGDLRWAESASVLGTRGETSGWYNYAGQAPGAQAGQSGGLPTSRPAGEDVTSFADMQLAEAEQNWMRRVVRAGTARPSQPAQVSGLVTTPDEAADAQLRKEQKAALTAARDAFLKVLTDFPVSALSRKCERGVQVIVRFFADRRRWVESAETLEAFAKVLPDHADTENIVFQAAEARTQSAVDQSAVAERAKLKEFADRFEAARTAWDAFVKRYPKSERNAIARFRRAYTFYQQALGSQKHHPDHATRSVLVGLGALEQMRAAEPNEPAFARVAALTYDAAVLLGRMKRYTLAADVYRRFVVAHPVDPRAPEAALKVAHLLNNFVGDNRAAVLAYQAYLHSYNSVQRDKVVRLLFNIGKGFHDRQEWTGAMMTFDLFLANYPEHPLAAEAALLRGDIFRANDAWPSAIAAYERAREEYPSAAVRGQVTFKIGRCYENLSQWQKAIDHYRRFLENHPRNKQNADVRFRVHVLADLARYQDVIDKYPDSTKRHWAQYEIARKTEVDLKNLDKAMIEYAKVVAGYPEKSEAAKSQLRIGEILFEKGRFADARDAFERLAMKFPTSSLVDNAHHMVGRSFEAEADREEKTTRAEKLEQLRQFHEQELFRLNY